MARAEQGYLEGLAPKKNKVVHKAALAYEDARNARMELSRAEKIKKDALIGAMQSEGLTRYEYGDLLVEVSANSQPKVKRTGEDAQNEEE